MSFAAQAASQLELAPSLGVGLEFALDRGDPRRPLPVRSSLAGAAFAVMVVVAVALFAASLDHLVSTPRLWGWTWDVGGSDSSVSLADVTSSCPAIKTRLTRVSGVRDVATICGANVEIGNHPLRGWAFAPVHGKIGATIVKGRAPAVANEIALGADTLDTTGTRLGGRVRVSGSRGRAQYRIVGRVVMPGLSDPEPLADAALFTPAGYRRIIGSQDNSGEWQLVVRFRPGVDRATVLSKLKRLEARESPSFGPRLPAEIDRLQQIDQLPWEIGGFVAVAATAGIGYALVTAVRRRRRELAVLKTLGFRRRQIRATVGWQASTVTMVGLVIGIPLGIVVGRFAWRLVADGLGVSTATSVPALAVIALVPAALILVDFIAALPARAAARTRPAVVLRSE
ncbi:MAG: FtsX-like permease family protein [Actinobacteria bacterium]|nr:MAG: FtsX-like permease family protein [Actinomycetota bacterium]